MTIVSYIKDGRGWRAKVYGKRAGCNVKLETWDESKEKVRALVAIFLKCFALGFAEEVEGQCQ
jgi:hypothetical protein